ncbi:NAD(P)/FAD-dependent oxidoreductase [Yoonia sp. R2331]|uniref:NAD(P)/FAD-dependent oxidoreductase n=1 Tax=Yoonia sp. R2331 TaxID=3237238 RepID=UPI0034E37EA9
MKDIVIVGAGLIGAALAYRLSAAGAKVTIVDMAGPAAGASGTSFGWINASFYKDAEHYRLRAAGIAAHQRLHQILTTGAYTWQPALWYEEQGDALTKMADDLRALDYPVSQFDQAQIADLEPNIVAPDAGLCFAAEGVVDAAALTRDLFAAAQANGARAVLGVTVQAVHRTAGKVTGVTTHQGVIHADQVVVAAGTGAADLIGLPMLTRPGLLMKTNALPPVLAHILVSPAGEVKQDAEGRLVMPTAIGHQADDSTQLAQTPVLAADAALARLQAMIPQHDLCWTEVALAYRPVPQDGLPVIGAVEPGLYACVMHSGVTLAAISAEYATQELLHGDMVNALGPYRPTRFD